MIRILLFLLVVFALGLGFAWLAERPGELVVTFSGYQYQVTLMTAAAVVTAIVAAVMILWWLVKSIWNSPYLVARYFRVRRRDRGYQALSTGMIAAGAGDGALARQKKREAIKLISSDQEPLVHLLDAQTSLLEGDHEAARKTFEAMLDDPEMRVLGLRGLYLEAERMGDRTAARHYAERASELAPQLGWASNATLEARTAEGDWDGALQLLDVQKSTKLVDADEGKRKRAVLLTAKAMDLIDSDPLAAKNAAIEANRLAPDLVPAAVMAAKALFRQDDLRKGSRILEAAWRTQAHPDIADAYIHARHGDSVRDRLARARRLQSLRQNNAESALVVARAALDAGEFDMARKSADSAIRMAPREGAYLLLADIEEAETGDQGRIRQWLARALRAPRDPVWVADGMVSERWLPFSPVTGRLDAFEWRAPVERAGPMIEDHGRPDESEEPALSAEIEEPKPALLEEVVEEATVIEPPQDDAGKDEPPKKPDGEISDDVATVDERAGKETGESVAEPKEEPAPSPIPDDPGVEQEKNGRARDERFRLF
ncbi:heme biosynthesis protein HemY [Mesorhizobium xinjiangense]|uniref:heme biosynthesis protein HemY n=1 Tax=Mesorhizobium xinjiangense TaxID=2678685 RepID=UPI0012EE079A|nr:heme biosynthesis protein HemY [Mesorhizobium xinjiangense]